MAIHTPLTESFGLDYPIVLAPMGGAAGGRLAAAVSNGGGLGLVGGGYGDPERLRRELALVTRESTRPWGAGLLAWRTTPELVEMILSFRPAAFLLGFGDPHPHIPAIKAAGCAVICQVQDVEMATQAVVAGADVIVAQGSEAGGHGSVRATLPLVPAVVDAVSPVPVLTAGGIADGRGLAAALMLGAHGVLMGTRFVATSESLTHEGAKGKIISARGGETARTQIFDVMRGLDWPNPFTGRILRNSFFERWQGREAELEAHLESERAGYRRAVEAGDFDTVGVSAGEAVDLITSVLPAADVVRQIGAEAEAQLRRGAMLLANSHAAAR